MTHQSQVQDNYLMPCLELGIKERNEAISSFTMVRHMSNSESTGSRK